MDITTTDSSLIRLMQLCSVSLPVGGYTFSQGLEYAIDSGWLRKQDQVRDWLEMQLLHSVSQVDLPLLRLLIKAAEQSDWQEVIRLNNLILACRETKELRLTDTAMGEALVRLLNSLEVPQPFEHGPRAEDVSFVSLFAIAASHWGINYETAALGFGWAWLENQIAAATKLVPLGQTQSQILLGELQPFISEAIRIAADVEEDQIGAGLPALSIASALHEQQYSRLFRS